MPIGLTEAADQDGRDLRGSGRASPARRPETATRARRAPRRTRPRPSRPRSDDADARRHGLLHRSLLWVAAGFAAAARPTAQDRRSLRAPRRSPREHCRQTDREQRGRCRLGNGGDGRADGNVVDAELQLRQVVGFGEAKTQHLAVVRAQQRADVGCERPVAGDQGIAHLREIQRQQDVCRGDAERVGARPQQVDTHLLVEGLCAGLAGQREIKAGGRGESIGAVADEKVEAQGLARRASRGSPGTGRARPGRTRRSSPRHCPPAAPAPGRH